MENKYQESLNWFQEQICAEKSDFCKSIKCCPKECSECSETRYYKTLQELIDKSIPKKPKSAYPLDECVWNNLHCPNCDEKVGALYIRDKYRDYTSKINYCTECGQALDWSEYE